MDVPIHFWYTIISKLYNFYVCVPHFNDLFVLVGCWASVSVRWIIYKILNVCIFDYTALSWAFVNRFNRTSGVTIFTPTDRPKSVRNRCLIEDFGGVFVLSLCFLDFSVGVGLGAFVIVRSLPFPLTPIVRCLHFLDGYVLTFWISIQKIFKSLQYWSSRQIKEGQRRSEFRLERRVQK